ncbi:winged helix-turn-helix domain-containing protein [Actinomadura sp. NPDC048394]|uniref:winged helix-turn-helix domain-containing protein n=1 Tax=Actinomadura sp. NPDC048394 TaxID=3158223 RepID=UPI0033F21FE4
MDAIDLDGATPLYRQVADVLESRIAAGTYPPGRRVPSSRNLADEFGVSRRTVVAALEILHEKGLVHGVVGRGTFVVETDD